MTSTTTSVAFRRSRVEEPDLDADRDRGERRRRLGEREAVEQASLWPLEPEDPSRESCRRRLSDEDDRKRQTRDRDHAHLGERRGIDEHPGRQEEEGDEQDASDELDLLHEPAPGGHQPIQGKPCEERAHDPLDPRAIGHERRRGERDDDEEKARAAVLADAGEHPARRARKDERAEQREDHEPDDHLEEDADRTRVARHRACDDGQHGEGERVRHHRPSAGDPDGAISEQPVLLHDRVRDEGVRRPERAEEHRRGEAIAEGQHEQDAEHEREGERERAEGQRAAPIGRELVEVELEAREEHQEEDPEVAERLDDAFALDPAEDERADEQPAEEDADDSGEAEALEDQRADENDGERDEERPLGGRRRKLEREQHGVSLQRAPDGDSAPLRTGLYAAARSANFAYRRSHESLIMPVGPLRCFARITSAIPCWSDSSPM